MKSNALVAVAYACAGVLCALIVYVVLDMSQSHSPSSDADRGGFRHFLNPYHRR